MPNRFAALFVAFSMVFVPALADTTSNMTVAPSNTQYSSPVTNANASTSNVSTQINNNNLGANSYGPGITCQSAQVALGGFGERQSAFAGYANADTGVTVQYLTPVGQTATHSCQALANEMVKQHQLDTQFSLIQKCADFARAGIILDPQTYPELSRACAGIHITAVPSGAAPVPAYPRSSYNAAPNTQKTAMLAPKRINHMSDFSPSHNGELSRIAMHRLGRLALLQGRARSKHLSRAEHVALNQGISHESNHLQAVIAEYQLENDFLRRIAKDRSWHSNEANANLRSRILSYNTNDSRS
jgi:hypothetical protein